MKTMNYLLVLTLLVVGACKNKDKFAGVRENVAVPVAGAEVVIAPQVDFLFVVDDSNSMSQLRYSLSNGLRDFANQIQNNQSWDVRVASTSTSGVIAPDIIYANKQSPGDPSFLRYTPSDLSYVLMRYNSDPNNPNAFEPGLGNARTFLQQYQHTYFRSNSLLVVVMITDEEDDTGTVRTRSDGLKYVDYENIANIQQNIIAAKGGDGSLIRFISVVPQSASSCSDNNFQNPEVGTRYLQMSGLFQSPTVDICSGNNESVPVSQVLSLIQSQVNEVRYTVYLKYIVLDKEPKTIDYITIDNKKYDGYALQSLGYQENFNIASTTLSNGKAAPSVLKSGYVYALPAGVQYTGSSKINIVAHYE